MVLNEIIIDNFKKLINLIEITSNYINKKEQNINKYRINSLKKSLKIITNYQHQIVSGEDIAHINGIGKGTIDRINEILKTNTLAELKDYDRILSKTSYIELIINDLMLVVGIGRITALELISKYKIKSAKNLKELVESNKIKVNDKIKIGLKYLGKFHGLIPKSEINIIYEYLQNQTHIYNNNMFITICGSYRRNFDFSSDIDILLCDLNLITMENILNTDNNYLSNYVKYLHKIDFLIDDITDKNIKTKYMGFGQLKTISNSKIRRIDIRLIPMESYFTALLYFTGSYQHNQLMRAKAKKLNYKLNEYGLYSNNSNQMIFVLSEQDIFNKLGMEYISPDNR